MLLLTRLGVNSSDVHLESSHQGPTPKKIFRVNNLHREWNTFVGKLNGNNKEIHPEKLTVPAEHKENLLV